eukprot:CAMPEP_0118719266 /NCGR_PEP_ID=MMETSP0800-20121206/29359_1 /TAXON_ID=210618 ORGANISM="Striatella unipunctata, Strain CCMP2910" /NCGR_SAMPLE_ID=MMETSP0800 /ASSEMBLY_ACC=CAM_ASM_000638 /LENGTH=359 /DNA_ID=CAMNT_0006626575 /DNA_START=87 /DNA_END=1166 /DNA_ORIENTATION=+
MSAIGAIPASVGNHDLSRIAVHLQSFLGCDGLVEEEVELNMQLLESATYRNDPEFEVNAHRESVRTLLKRSIQRYTYRLFMLPTMERIINHFLDITHANKPTLDRRELDKRGRSQLKEKALEAMHTLQDFMDRLQELVMDGCMDDFLSIAERRDFVALRHLIWDGPSEENCKTYRERLFREAVREQIEIEVYVPLRSAISKLLVHGWKHDDMEMHFKVEELRKRPQSSFNIPHSNSGWSSVSRILHDGVGKKTLPCSKLRAIVDAANQVSLLYSSEHPKKDGEDEMVLGADDFLPIFIYCVVRAEMERPCALCVLLRTLCDAQDRIGQVGYYLACFEAAIAHIQEWDLSLFPNLTLIGK